MCITSSHNSVHTVGIFATVTEHAKKCRNAALGPNIGACAGKESSVSSLKSRMAALKKGMGIGSSDVKGTKLAAAAAATDAMAIQHRMACIIQVRKTMPYSKSSASISTLY